MNNFLKRSLFVFVLFIVSIFVLTTMSIIYDGLNDNLHKSDVAIIFGSKVNQDGTLSKRLTARLNKGIELYNENMVTNFIVSGATGIEGRDEAIAMHDYLITHHIPAAAIISDSFGSNTKATAKNSIKLMQIHGFKSAIIVSQYFHIQRATLAFEQCGIATVYSVHANYFEWRDIYSIAREVIGYYSYLLLDKNC